jgi:hypothetical protein
MELVPEEQTLLSEVTCRLGSKVWLNDAAAGACSLETTSTVSPYRPSAGVIDSEASLLTPSI